MNMLHADQLDNWITLGLVALVLIPITLINGWMLYTAQTTWQPYKVAQDQIKRLSAELADLTKERDEADDDVTRRSRALALVPDSLWFALPPLARPEVLSGAARMIEPLLAEVERLRARRDARLEEVLTLRAQLAALRAELDEARREPFAFAAQVRNISVELEDEED